MPYWLYAFSTWPELKPLKIKKAFIFSELRRFRLENFCVAANNRKIKMKNSNEMLLLMS